MTAPHIHARRSAAGLLAALLFLCNVAGWAHATVHPIDQAVECSTCLGIHTAQHVELLPVGVLAAPEQCLDSFETPAVAIVARSQPAQKVRGPPPLAS